MGGQAVMASKAQAKVRVHPAWYAFWGLFVAASAFFMADSIASLPAPQMQPGSTFWNRTVWYVGHAVMALPILVIAPFQFMPGLRQNRPQVHRWLGRVFLANCMIAALLGIYLGSTIMWPGSRIPLSLLGALWFGFAAIAWQAARRRDFLNHRRFAIRAFALGSAFVLVRLIGAVRDSLLAFIPLVDTRETTTEWLTLFLPLIVTETWLTWGPAARKLFAPQR
jgi:uncharacterized membrane protein